MKNKAGQCINCECMYLKICWDWSKIEDLVSDGKKIHVFGFGEKFFIIYVYGGIFSLTFNILCKIKLSKAYVMSIIWISPNLCFETKQVNCVFCIRLKKILVTDD